MLHSSKQVMTVPLFDGVHVRSNHTRWWLVLIVMTIALVSARPYAGSWNDGGRLASIESIVDYHTLSIDQSVFVDVNRITGAALPYPADNVNLIEHGTRDKLLIDGHYYSDKPMVQSVAMAGVYAFLQYTTGLVARDRPDIFAYVMTLLSSGIAYFVAVWGVARFGDLIGLSRANSILLAMSFALATAALPYACHVNQHIIMLALAVWILVDAHELCERADSKKKSLLRVARMGLMAGLAYGIDFGAGAPLAMLTGLFVIMHRPSLKSIVTVSAAMLPGLILYHGLNYSIGGSLLPANANVDYLRFPGSPFSAENATGGWKHASPLKLLLYGADLLWGKRGFLEHNVPLLLIVFGGFKLWKSKHLHRSMAFFCITWCGLTWLTYAAGSNNLSGACYSIRWFVPLLAAGYYLIAALIRERPELRPHFLFLSAWGMLMAGLGWWYGPWSVHMVPMYWIIVFAIAMSWGYLTWRLHRSSRKVEIVPLNLPFAETSEWERPAVN